MINWLTALKILPWKDMIDYAPHVVSGAQKLWQRVKNEKAETDAIIIEQAPLDDAAHELQELKKQLQDTQAQQLELSNLLNELAAQNQRLVTAVDVLRVRTRVLLWGITVLAIGVVVLAVRVI